MYRIHVKMSSEDSSYIDIDMCIHLRDKAPECRHYYKTGTKGKRGSYLHVLGYIAGAFHKLQTQSEASSPQKHESVAQGVVVDIQWLPFEVMFTKLHILCVTLMV